MSGEPRAWERAAILGAGVGLLLGSLAMWRTDTTTAATGTASGFLVLLLVLVTRRPKAPEAKH